ncbi:MAG TPA: membrane protein insertion efficiency factor YidD [Oscillospiraceae bacterium]|nr:membrane protein insertion efficiency factor YidD [Oscillospiraceae bacterium]HNW04752.1 membrane protein insertion efficiency factor YidD [Oscillospiraceae bacterium]HPW00706.1 membrane protein insertion efficiency factor YidD [Oscillospiraceae bacterium]
MKKLLLFLIRFYQRAISAYTPACCRYYPTCSAYAVTAIERFGALRGGLLAVIRVLRCHPYHAGGFDPVPEEWDLHYYKKQKSRRKREDHQTCSS